MRSAQKSLNKGQAGFLIVALCLAFAMMRLNWVGYDGADDLSYALAAENWVRHFPALGADHWALRYTIVLPVALSLRVFGQNELALCIPNVSAFLGLVTINYYFGSRYLGARAGGFLSILLALTPEFIVQATYINIDVIEVFFVSLSFWLLISGIIEPRRRWAFGASGLAAGLAFLTRETSCVLIPLSVVGFFFCPASARKSYLWFYLGFAAVIGVELAYFYSATGDIFYRYRLDAHHDTVDRTRVIQQTTAKGQILDKEGGISVNVFLDPLLMLFASQKYGLLFYIALPMGIWLYKSERPSGGTLTAYALVSWISMLWIVFVSCASPILYLVPRYFVVPAWSCSVIIALALDRLIQRRNLRIAAGTVGVLLVVNALSLYLENENPRFAERSLVRYLQAHPQALVHVDPDTARRVSLLGDFTHVTKQISTAPITPGALVFISPRNLELCPPKLCAQLRPQLSWVRIASFQEKPRAVGRLLRATHLATLIPPQIMAKIEQPLPGATLYDATSVSPAL